MVGFGIDGVESSGFLNSAVWLVGRYTECHASSLNLDSILFLFPSEIMQDRMS
jgi:hypothetical protein